MRKVLVLDDSPDNLEIFDFLLAPFFRETFAIQPDYCLCLSQALAKLNHEYIAVISDYHLGGSSTADELYYRWRHLSSNPFIFFSSSDHLPIHLHDPKFYICRNKNWRLLKSLLTGIMCAEKLAPWSESDQGYFFE